MKIFKSQSGFTFIEVLVVAVLIVVLTTIAMVSYRAISANTRDARRKQDADNIRVSLESYRQANGAYPLALAGAIDTDEYLTEIPVDPLTGKDPTHPAYTYQRLSTLEYRLTVFLENDNDPLINGANNAYAQEEPK